MENNNGQAVTAVRTLWYRCPQQHTFEVPSKQLHYFCSLCQKIYTLKNSVEVVRLPRPKLSHDASVARSKKGWTSRRTNELAQQRAEKLAKASAASARYRKTHPDRVAERRRMYWLLHEKGVTHKPSPRLRTDPEYRDTIRQYHRAYDIKHRADPTHKNWMKSYSSAMRGLAMLGLGLDPSKEYRKRKKLKAILAKMNAQSRGMCTRCRKPMVLNMTNGIMKCPDDVCGYWMPPTHEILATIFAGQPHAGT